MGLTHTYDALAPLLVSKPCPRIYSEINATDTARTTPLA